MKWLKRIFGQTDDGAQSQPRCVACDGSDLTTFAPEAYRCGDCGHEGGEGYPAWSSRQRIAALVMLSPQDLQHKANEGLDELVARLLSATGVEATHWDDTAARGNIHITHPRLVYLKVENTDEPGSLSQAKRDWCRSDLIDAQQSASLLHEILTAWAAKSPDSPEPRLAGSAIRRLLEDMDFDDHVDALPDEALDEKLVQNLDVAVRLRSALKLPGYRSLVAFSENN